MAFKLPFIRLFIVMQVWRAMGEKNLYHLFLFKCLCAHNFKYEFLFVQMHLIAISKNLNYFRFH